MDESKRIDEAIKLHGRVMTDFLEDIFSDEEYKRCPNCKEIKPKISSFGTSGWCKDCSNIKRKTEPEKVKRRKWRKEVERFSKYKITKEDYEILVAQQDNKCGICDSDKPGGRFKTWHIDHDHKTGTNRGILCARCNLFLGWYEIYLSKIVNYLGKYK